MLKRYIYMAIWCLVMPAHAVVIGPNMLANSPAGYLFDIDLFWQRAAITRQIGRELYKRDYQVVDPDREEPGRFDERPLPPHDSPFPVGQWVWLPDSLNAHMGVWYWIKSQTPYYITYLKSLMPS